MEWLSYCFGGNILVLNWVVRLFVGKCSNFLDIVLVFFDNINVLYLIIVIVIWLVFLKILVGL